MDSDLDRLEQGSGNVFLDLGLEDADDLKARAELVLAVKKVIRERGLTQRKAAGICKTDQPTLCKVLQGRLDLVSTDRLFAWLMRLGKQVTVRIEDAEPGHEPLLQVCCA